MEQAYTSGRDHLDAGGPLGRFMRWIGRQHPLTLMAILLLTQTLVHLVYLDLPPSGRHVWRQTQTLSVARNFYEEGGSILEPRVDSRGHLTGIAGMEFPLVNYVISLGYHAFGYSYLVQRTVMLLFSFPALIGCFLFARSLFRSRAHGFLAAMFLLFSPMFLFFSITVMPDIPSLGLLFLSLAFWELSKEKESKLYLAWGLLFLAVAMLIKINAGMVLLYYAYDALWGKAMRPRRSFTVAGLAAAVAIVAAWYLYAGYLGREYGNKDFVMHAKFPYPVAMILPRLNETFVKWLPEFVVNYAEFILLISGIVTVATKVRGRLGLFALTYTLPFLAFVVLMLPHLNHHEYYLAAVLPLLIVLATLGLDRALVWSSAARYRQALVLALLVLVPILGCARALPRFHRMELPQDLDKIETHLTDVIPDQQELIVAAHDVSPSVYLYYMHRRGWTATDTIRVQKFDSMLVNGAKYLVSDSRKLESREEIRRHLTKLSSFGNFNVFRLQPGP